MNIDPNDIPLTLDAAADRLVESLTAAERIQFQESEVHDLHFAAGLSLRNNWRLFESGSPLFRDARVKHGVFDADSISGLILKLARNRIIEATKGS